MNGEKDMKNVNKLLLAAMALGAPLTTMMQGAPVLAETQTAGASITIRTDKTLTGKKFLMWQLFETRGSQYGDSWHYTFVSETKEAIQQVLAPYMHKKADQITAEEAADFLRSLQQDPAALRQVSDELSRTLPENEARQIVPDTSPEYTIRNLDYGYYLLKDVSGVGGSHTAASLCLMTTAAPDSEINLKADYPVLEKQIHEDDGNIGWNDIGDYEIGQTIPYRFRTSIPDMTGYKTYLFRFHDEMDPALQMDEASLKLEIEDGDRTYVLDQNEYELKRTSSHAFTVTIPDLKAIVDAHHSGTLTLTYDARLTEAAAGGQEGFENRVRLEFSNNPNGGGQGSTGFTPWDTVVAFTFHVNGLKTDADDRPLKGAEFALYRDEACTDQITMKKTGTGYVPDASVNDPVRADENGQFLVAGLDQGTYYLKETRAPDGYRPLAAPIKLTLVPAYVEDRNSYESGQTALESFAASAGIQQLETEDMGANLQVINRPESTLPETGGIGLLAAAGGILLMAAARRKK